MRPPLDLNAEITTADGTRYLWGSWLPHFGDVPSGLTFGTRRGDGFAQADLTLTRRIDRDYPDLNLLDSLVIFGGSGDIAYEGRVNGMPRSLDAQRQTIGVNTAGWLSHARDQRMSSIYIDQDISTWATPTAQRQLNLLGGGFNPITGPEVLADATGRALKTAVGASAAKPISEALYDAGPRNLIAKLLYAWTRSPTVVLPDANWFWRVAGDATSAITAPEISANLAAAGPGTGTLTLTTAVRYLVAQLFYNAAIAVQGEYAVHWTRLAAVGDHGLELIGDAGAEGVAASDVIRHVIETWCPKLNAAGVQDTTYPIEQLAFRERVHPYDVLTQVNAYHRWSLGVWEDRTVHYAPVDLSDYDWEIRLSDPGVTTTLQGDTLEHLANGIEVEFYDVGKAQWAVAHPDDHAELRDESVENPANQHQARLYPPLRLSFPTTLDGALQIGRMALAELNQPRGIGTINARGHIRDRAGHWQPVWKVRADDRIAITDSTSLTDRPRLIGETTYRHDTHELTAAVDSTLPRVETILDRFGSALDARGLTA